MTKVKVCGLRSTQDIQFANELHPDYVGFVFYKPKYRYVSPNEAARLRQLLDPSIPAVGVFVDEPLEHVISMLEQGIIQMAQLHGHEDESYILSLKAARKEPVIKVSLIDSEEAFHHALHSPADYLLFDSGLGAGKPFDWSLIQDTKRDFFLAGGLTSDNVVSAIERLHPFAVDASSSLETNHKKDYKKMEAFINAVKEMR